MEVNWGVIQHNQQIIFLTSCKKIMMLRLRAFSGLCPIIIQSIFYEEVEETSSTRYAFDNFHIQ